jgi:hypothetical protein
MSEDTISTSLGVENMVDSVNKILPVLAGAAASAGLGVATNLARDRVTAKRRELEQAEKVEETASVQAESQQLQPGSPRDEATITGFKNDNSGVPQTDGEIPPDDPRNSGVSISRAWFLDNFGMTSSEISDILLKNGDSAAYEAIMPLLKMERREIFKQFAGVSPLLVNKLPLTDADYDSLNKYPQRLDIPFRRFVKMWEEAENEEERGEAGDMWRSIVDLSERLSFRERNLLQKCRGVLKNRGALNAQTLKTYGIAASPAEISSLIKSHGFLYDIITVGQVSKTIGRGLFYDVKRREILLKDTGQFLAGLIGTQSADIFKFDKRLNPRIEFFFSAPNAPWYASALKSELNVENIRASGSRLVIEGEIAVKKALEVSSEYLNGDGGEARKMLRALNGDKSALIVLAYDLTPMKDRASILKTHRIKPEDFVKLREEVMSVG